MIATARRRGVRRLVQVGVACLVGLGSAGVILELTIRVFDPLGVSYFRNFAHYRRVAIRPSTVTGLGFEPVPGIEFEAGVPVRINSLGLRGPETTIQKPTDTWRMLVLGDSIAFGWGVPEDVTLEAQIGRELAARRRGAVEVLNAGVVMFNLEQERALFEDRGANLSPDAVLLVVCGNDFLPACDESCGAFDAGPRPAALDGVVSRMDWWLMTNSSELATADLLRHLTTQRLLHAVSGERKDDWTRRARAFLRGYVQSRSGELRREANLAALDGIAARCRALGATLLVASWGAPPEVAPACARLGVRYVAEPPRAALDPALQISVCDAHPNASGHRVIAEAVVAALGTDQLAQH
jgi:hypothetical protein